MDVWSTSIAEGNELNPEQVRALCDALFDSNNPVEIRAGWLEALARKGESAIEIAAFVQTLLGRAVHFPKPKNISPTMDVCGTGGDKLGMFNVSTAVMFVAAAAGARVVKHGNRGVTSKSGGADCLEAVGVRIDISPEQASAVLDETGCVFLFAQKYHPTFREVAPVRQKLAERGIITVFNKLGPLLNPAMPARQLAGVYDEHLVPLYAKVFAELGRQRAWAVHGRTVAGGMDELSTMGACVVSEVIDGNIRSFELHPQDYGLLAPHPSELLGGDAAANAAMLQRLVAGEAPQPIADVVCWNAAAALVVAGISPDVGEGLALARQTLSDGTAAKKLSDMIAITGRYA